MIRLAVAGLLLLLAFTCFTFYILGYNAGLEQGILSCRQIEQESETEPALYRPKPKPKSRHKPKRRTTKRRPHP